MNLLKWFDRRERRDMGTPPFYGWCASGPTVAGTYVEPATAMAVPAVFACCQVLSQDIARTPIRLRRRVSDDTYEDAVEHPLYEILHDLANPETTAYQFKAAMQWSLLQYGRAFAEIVRVDGRVVALWWLDPSQMFVDRTPARIKRWTYAAGPYAFDKPGVYTFLFDPSQPPILELTMESPVQRCRDLIGAARALQIYVGAFFANGAQPSGVVRMK